MRARVKARLHLLAGSAARMDWLHRAACRDEDPELFFPAGTDGPALAQIKQAKTVCRRCPVTGECLSWALGAGEDYGIWGGTTEWERRIWRRVIRNDRSGPQEAS